MSNRVVLMNCDCKKPRLWYVPFGGKYRFQCDCGRCGGLGIGTPEAEIKWNTMMWKVKESNAMELVGAEGMLR